MRLIPRIRRRGIALTLAVGLITPVATLTALTTLATPAGALTGDITTVAGGGPSSLDGVDASNVTMNNPTSVAVDGHGNTLIADSLDHEILVVAKSASNPGYPLPNSNCTGGECTWTQGDIFAIAGSGSQGFTGDGGVATAATLHNPADVAVDPVGNLIIADQLNSAIRVLAMSASNPGYALRADCAGACTWTAGDIFTIAGNGSQGYGGDGGVSSSAQLSAPGNVAVDVHGNVLISDTVNARIRVIAIAASNPGYQLNTGSWAIGSIFTIAGDGVTSYGGDGANAVANGTRFSNPHGLTVDADGNVIVADTSNNRIRVIAVSATVPGYVLNTGTWTVGDVYTIAGSASFGYGGDGGSAIGAGAKLSAPNDVTIDSSGNIVIADLANNRVRVVALSSVNPGYALNTGTWTTVDLFTIAGSGSSGYGGDGGSAIAAGAKLNFPEGVAFDPQGNLLIADELNLRIRSVQYGDGLHFTVPAGASDPNGYDSGFHVDNNVTLSASGSWCTNDSASLCTDPNGNADFVMPDNFVSQFDPAWALLARIGTTDPWTYVGSGGSLTGTGELYFIMNDDIDSNCGAGSVQNCFLDNTGALDVSVDFSMSLSTTYNTGGSPVFAGTTLHWEGRADNTGNTTVTNVYAVADNGLFFSGTYLSDDPGPAPTWTTYSGGEVPVETGSGTCEAIEPWYCDVGDLAPGEYVIISSDIPTQGFAPGTLNDFFEVGADQGYGYVPSTTQQIDGLAFNINVPDPVYAGDVLTASGYVTNTSASEDITNIVTYGIIDKGSFISGPASCEFTNNLPLGTGGIERCSAATWVPPTFTLPAGTDSPTVSFNIDTTGLGGQSINYTDFATSPDIGGVSYIETGSVDVVAPGIAINTPAANATLARTVDNEFTATATADNGDSITFVAMKLDGVVLANISSPPYSVTLPANSLTVGAHLLTAVAHQASGPNLTKPILVNAVQRPMVTIVPPSGFVSGGILDTAKAFTATAVPSAPATIASIDWDVDGSISVPSLANNSLAATVDPSQLTLSTGLHTLHMTATDSVGQTRTASFDFTIPQATLEVCNPDALFSVASCTPTVQPIGSPPAPATITPGADSGWTVQVDNISSYTARHVVLTLDATATDTSNVQTALSFDQHAINGALGRAPSTASCQPGSGSTIVCALPDIPATSAVQFPVFAAVPGTFTGPPNVVEATVTGSANASAANADASGPAALGSMSVESCEGGGVTACFQTILAAGTTASSSTNGVNATDTTAQTIQVPISTQSEAKVIRFGRPFPLQRGRIVAGKGLRLARVTFKPRVATDPTLRAQLASIDPATATDPVSVSLCTTVISGAGPCQGQISEVSAAFDPYINPVNPILVVISALWDSNGPPGHFYVQKVNTDGSPRGGPALVPACTQDALTRAFTNTPCRLPEIVKTLTTINGTTKTSYTPILFIGADPHFARR